jgi:hypothetical protein
MRRRVALQQNMEGPSSYELTGVRNIQLSHASITTLPVILHPSISQATLLTPHLRKPYVRSPGCLCYRRGEMQRLFQGYRTEHCSFFSGHQEPPSNEAQATTSLNHGCILGLSQSGPGTVIRPCRLLETPIHHSSTYRVGDHRCLSPFLLAFHRSKASDEFCAVGVPASRRYTDAGAPEHQQSRDPPQCP